jgi:hypothetical protein
MSYLSDLTDEQWALLVPVFHVSASADPAANRT